MNGYGPVLEKIIRWLAVVAFVAGASGYRPVRMIALGLALYAWSRINA